MEIHVVKYNTLISRDFKHLKKHPDAWCKALTMDLPARVRDKKWGVVIVDGPMGFLPANPGRFQALYEAAHLVAPGGFIVVDDCERAVERDMSRLFYGENNMVTNITRGANDVVRITICSFYFHIF